MLGAIDFSWNSTIWTVAAVVGVGLIWVASEWHAKNYRKLRQKNTVRDVDIALQMQDQDADEVQAHLENASQQKVASK